jgi:hypothetical protein
MWPVAVAEDPKPRRTNLRRMRSRPKEKNLLRQQELIGLDRQPPKRERCLGTRTRRLSRLVARESEPTEGEELGEAEAEVEVEGEGVEEQRGAALIMAA